MRASKPAKMSSPSILLALLLVACGVKATHAEPVKSAGVEPSKPVAAPKSPEKLVAFEMRDKPWGSVLEWLTDQTGLPVITAQKPTGTFTFIAPRMKQYSIPDVIDILNEALLAQKYVLIRRDASFTLVPADEKIDPAILPRISLADLAHRGNTEIVSVVLPLTAMVAEDLATEVKKMMGPFGEVVAMARANQLVMQDTAGNLKRIAKLIKELEEDEKGQAQSFSHTCKFIKARDAERILRDLLGDTREINRAAAAAQPQPFGGFGGGSGFGGGGSGFGGGGFGGGGQRGASPASSAAPVAKHRMHYITSDERLNTVLVTGPADKIAAAKEILRKIDVSQEGQQPVLPGPPFLKTYTVPNGNAEVTAKTLQDIYKASNVIRIAAVGSNSIMVWAGPDDQFEIARHVLGASERPNGITELLPLETMEASKVADTLKGMFGDPKAGGPFIEAETERNAIIAKGTREQIEDVKLALKAIGEGGTAANAVGNVRIMSLGQGSAATLAEAVERLLTQMRKNPVRVIVPGSDETKPALPKMKPAAEEDKGQGGLDPKTTDPKMKPAAEEEQEEKTPLANGGGKQPFGVNLKKPPEERPGNVQAPVTITAFGNRLVVASEDPEALALVQELVRLLTRTPPGEGDFEIIRLKNANASDAARILDETFNGTRQQQQQQQTGGFQGGQQGGGQQGFFQRFGGRGGNTVSNPSANRIRVVADPTTNSLLVRASPLDMLTIRRLLDKALDTGETDSLAVIRTWIIGPLKFATATEVAGVLHDVYHNQMGTSNNNNSFANAAAVLGFPAMGVGGVSGFGGSGGGGSGGGSRGGAFGQRQSDQAQGAKLSIGVDERSNTLILACPQALYDDIKKLVDQLEAVAKDSTRTVRVVSIKGIDPVLVQQAIDAIQGRRGQGQQGAGGQSSFGSNTSANRSQGQGTGSSFRSGGSGSSGGFSPFSSGGGGFLQGGGGAFPSGGGPGPGGAGGGGGFGPRPGGGGGGGPGGPGGGRPGGGGGGRPGGRSAGITGSRGSDFFVERVKDDPRTSVLYDPNPDLLQAGDTANGMRQQTATINPFQLVGFEEQQAPPAAPPAPAVPPVSPEGSVRAPRSPVVVDALEELGVVVISGNTPTDVEEIVRIIEYIQKLGAGSEVLIQLVPLEIADATSVSNILTQLFQRVVIGATGNILRAQGTSSATVLGQSGQAASVVLLPLPRFNSILLAAPKARMEDMIKEIKRLDRAPSAQGTATAFPLKKAAASRVANLIQQFFSQRYPNETSNQNQVRVTADDSTNTVFVQAAPGDLAEISTLITRIDSTVSNAINDLRIVQLKNTLSDELASVLQRAISDGVVTASSTAAPSLVPSTLPGLGQTSTQSSASRSQTSGKSTTLRFITARRDGPMMVQSGLLEDVHVSSEARTNSLILSAPAQTMELLLALVRELDVVSSLRARVNIFNLKRADASITAATLQQLFLGTSSTTGARTGATGTTGTSQGSSVTRPTFTLGDTTPEGSPLIALRFTVDDRTNSIIVAGSENDLRVIEALVSRLEDTDVDTRHNEVYKLRNAAAADVATALTNFWVKYIGVYSSAQQLTAFQEIQRDVIVISEPVSNTLLISATPRYFEDIMRLIQVIDAQPPQVVVQVLVAEVDTSNNEEFGVEIGLQSPVLFSRSVIPADGFIGPNGTVNYASVGTNSAVTVNSSINPAASPGFNFNTTSPLGNNPVVSPGVVGFQGLSSLNTGRVSPTANVGGFVFSAASNSFNLLIRALKQQGRLDILSRPQIMTLDNQTAYINVGQEIPIVTSSNVTATGIITTNIDRRNVGVILQITPRISPDGTVIMRVIPEISSVDPTPVQLGNGNVGTALNIQHLETSVLARDGETVALGGLMLKKDQKNENKYPFLGDLPGVGALFRYRTQNKTKSELLIILTPHIVRSSDDAKRVLSTEARRIDWVLSDVAKMHGTSGMEFLFPGSEICPPGSNLSTDPANRSLSAPLSLPAEATTVPGTLPPGIPVPSKAPETLPGPAIPAPATTVPGTLSPGLPVPSKASETLPRSALPATKDPLPNSQPIPPQVIPPVGLGPTSSEPPEARPPVNPPPVSTQDPRGSSKASEKEKRGWKVFPWN